MISKARRFDQLTEKVTDFAIIFMNAQGIIEEWNIGAERLFGYAAEEAVNQPSRILFIPEDNAKDASQLEMKTAVEKGIAENERWLLRRDGSHFYASGSLHALYEEGVLTGFVKIVKDLTERLEMEAALQSSREFLDIKVQERTSEQGEVNKVLRLEMVTHKRNDFLRVRLMQRIIDTQEDEKKRISRDIHDHLGQEMTGLKLQLQFITDQFGKDAELTEQIEKAQEIADKIDASVDFIAWELRPAALEELGLNEALNTYVKEWSKHFKVSADIHTKIAGNKRLVPVIEVNLYRILQEALHNIAKHAEATNVSVLLENPDHRVILIVEDDGIGFDVEENAYNTQKLGLIGMAERASLLDGEIEIESAIGKGTTVYVRVPAIFEEPAET